MQAGADLAAAGGSLRHQRAHPWPTYLGNANGGILKLAGIGVHIAVRPALRESRHQAGWTSITAQAQPLGTFFFANVRCLLQTKLPTPAVL